MNQSFVIDTDVPAPSHGRIAKWPFISMRVGESVFIEGEKTDGNAYAAARKLKRRKGMEFVGRSVDGGVRIWRTK